MKYVRTATAAACLGIAGFFVACGGGDVVEDVRTAQGFPHMDPGVEYMIFAGADENLNAGADEDLTAEDMRAVLEAHQEAQNSDEAKYWSNVQSLVHRGHVEWVKGEGGYYMRKRGE